MGTARVELIEAVTAVLPDVLAMLDQEPDAAAVSRAGGSYVAVFQGLYFSPRTLRLASRACRHTISRRLWLFAHEPLLLGKNPTQLLWQA